MCSARPEPPSFGGGGGYPSSSGLDSYAAPIGNTGGNFMQNEESSFDNERRKFKILKIGIFKNC